MALEPLRFGGAGGHNGVYDQGPEPEPEAQIFKLKKSLLGNLKAVIDGRWDAIQDAFQLPPTRNHLSMKYLELEHLTKRVSKIMARMYQASDNCSASGENRKNAPENSRKVYADLVEKLDKEVGEPGTETGKVSGRKKRSCAVNDDNEDVEDPDESIVACERRKCARRERGS